MYGSTSPRFSRHWPRPMRAGDVRRSSCRKALTRVVLPTPASPGIHTNCRFPSRTAANASLQTLHLVIAFDQRRVRPPGSRLSDEAETPPGCAAPSEAVAFPGNCFDQGGVTEGFPQCVDVVSKVVLFDNRVRPDCRDEVVFSDQTTRLGHEHTERIEHLSAQLDRASVAQKPPLCGLEAERSELVHALHLGTSSIRQRKTPGKIKNR